MGRAAPLRPLIFRIARRVVAGAVVATILLLPFAGRFLARADALEHADLIMVLGGARIERWLEAVDLYKAGWAPRLVISPGQTVAAEAELLARGVRYPREGDLAHDAVLALGVPASAVAVLPNGVDNTAAEATLLRQTYQSGQLNRIIVVTSPYHLRRAGYAFRREFAGSGVTIIMHASRYDIAEPARWWTHRKDIRYMMSELPKFAAYLAGLGE
jgi:uncharacterized SAM-binding protein YcdF (DUF218 family)